MVCDEEIKHKEGDEESQWNASLNLSNSEIFCQENMYLLNPVEKKNDISLEVLEKHGVVKSNILNEVVDISFKNGDDNSFQSSCEYQFDNMQELLFGQVCHD